MTFDNKPKEWVTESKVPTLFFIVESKVPKGCTVTYIYVHVSSIHKKRKHITFYLPLEVI